MSKSKHYTCHVCGFGPYHYKLYSSCIECNHEFCTKCPYEYIKDDVEPRQGTLVHTPSTALASTDTTAEQSQVAALSGSFQISPSPNHHTFPPGEVCLHASQIGQEAHTTVDTGLDDIFLLPAGHVCVELEVLASDPRSAPPAQTYYWNCGGCGDGPMTTNIPACAVCGHWRDECCKTYLSY